jgi:hypothetical protein
MHVISALLWTILGAIIAGAGQIFLAYYNSCREARGLAIALRAEIESLIELAEMRRYLEGLELYEVALMTPDRQPAPSRGLLIRVEQRYFDVFDSARARLGLLGEVSGRVVKAYTYTKAFLEDARDLSLLYESGGRIGEVEVSNEDLIAKVHGAHAALSLAIQHGKEAIDALTAFAKRSCLARARRK